MPKVGDRVVIEGNKVGQQRREGSLLGVVGSLIRVRWSDGSESLITPGAGAVTFLPGRADGRGPLKKAAAAKPRPAPARSPAKRAVAKAKTPRKPAAVRKPARKKSR